MLKIAPVLVALMSLTAPAFADPDPAADPQTAFIDVPERHPCQGKLNVFLATLERTPEPTWVYHGFGSFEQARQDWNERINRQPLPDEANIRCDLTPYQPARD
jgi:hypothetical protein